MQLERILRLIKKPGTDWPGCPRLPPEVTAYEYVVLEKNVLDRLNNVRHPKIFISFRNSDFWPRVLNSLAFVFEMPSYTSIYFFRYEMSQGILDSDWNWISPTKSIFRHWSYLNGYDGFGLFVDHRLDWWRESVLWTRQVQVWLHPPASIVTRFTAAVENTLAALVETRELGSYPAFPIGVMVILVPFADLKSSPQFRFCLVWENSEKRGKLWMLIVVRETVD